MVEYLWKEGKIKKRDKNLSTGLDS